MPNAVTRFGIRCLLLMTVILSLACVSSVFSAPGGNSDSTDDQWLIQISPNADPKSVARGVGAEYVEPLRDVDGYHRVRFIQQAKQGTAQEVRERIAQKLKENSKIRRFHKERKIELYPRAFNPPDPFFSEQWHHQNTGQTDGLAYADLQVRPVWDQGYNGTGSVIGIVDTGTEYEHPDLQANWLTGYGKDYLSGDNDPSPVSLDESHGTAVAGITAAVSNSIGGLGIAYRAKFVPLRLIGNGVNIGDGDIASALSYNKDSIVDIYNNSWGPSDSNGIRYAPIDENNYSGALDSIEFLDNILANNVQTGRSGLGNIYVWAAGNGGLNGDKSNYDGYNSSPYTISVGAVGDDDVRSGYSEGGANLLLVAPSGGRGAGIFTTDNTGTSGYTSGDYFENFSGTSAAAPMVSGVVALMLDVRPGLNWRDVQQILARTAVPVDFDNKDWVQNGAGLWVSHEYGFGRVDAHAAVGLSRDWSSPGQMLSILRSQSMNRSLGQNQTSTGSIFISSNMEVQFVRVKVTMNHSDWGDLRIELESPSGTVRTLSSPHANSNRAGFPGSWTYLSTQNLGESASGTWKLHVTDAGSAGSGSWTSWQLQIMGHAAPANRNPVGDNLAVSSINYPIEIDVKSGLTDLDGDPLNILSVQNPRFGELVEIGDGRFSYTMGETKAGVDTFSVLVGDGNGGVKRRIITVSNPLPVARNDLFPVKSGVSTNLPVLANDRDADGDNLRITTVSGVLSEFATIIEQSSIQFDSPAGLKGAVSFQYSITDDSDGSSTGKVTLILDENPDVALAFDGVDDHMVLDPGPNVSLNDRFTVEAMIYPESYGEYVSGFGRIYDRETFIFFLNGEYPHAFYNPRSLVVYLTTDSGQTYAINTFSNTIQLNKWQHVAVSYDSSDFSNPVRVYIDGEQVGVNYPEEVSSARPTRPISDNSIWSLYIGESESGARAFRGKMSEFRIWNRVLSSTTIRLQHDKKMTGSEIGLRLYLPLTETLEPIARSTGSYTGTLQIYEAQRVPKFVPSNELHAFYATLEQTTDGWSYNPTLGWISGENLPWIYSARYGWLYTGHSAYSDELNVYSPDSAWHWILTSDILYPWHFRPADNKWLWYQEGSGKPAYFYDILSSGWLPL